jgi:hypothetical protein
MIGRYFGCDVSYCQKPGLVPWVDPRLDFAIVRATNGASVDHVAAAHVAKVRAAAKRLSLYAFFQPNETPRGHFEAIDQFAAASGYGSGDLVPAVDVEWYPGHPVTTAWAEPLRELVDMLTEAYQARPLLYMRSNTWKLMGAPAWALDCPFWIGWYPVEGHLMNLSPPGLNEVPGGGDWAIWQFGAGRLFGSVQEQFKPYSVDQNRANRLPLIGGGVLE